MVTNPFKTFEFVFLTNLNMIFNVKSGDFYHSLEIFKSGMLDFLLAKCSARGVLAAKAFLGII